MLFFVAFQSIKQKNFMIYIEFSNKLIVIFVGFNFNLALLLYPCRIWDRK